MKLTPFIIKKTGFISIMIIASITHFSCSKEWLEAKADKSATVPETLSDLQGLMDNVTIMTQQYPRLGEISADLHYVTDNSYETTRKDMYSDAYIWKKTSYYSNVGDWDNSYKKVLIDNVVLERLEKISPTTSQDELIKNDIKGQALFNRARIFFELALLFAPPYDKNAAERLPGIVLRLNSDITLPSRRNNLKQTYDQILSDLILAYDLLSAHQPMLTRPSKAAAAALLSRIFLYMGNYEKSLEYSTQCLNMKSDLLDFNNLSKTRNYIGRYNEEVIYHTNFAHTFLTTKCLIDKDLVESYDPNDLRRVIFFKSTAPDNFIFKGNYESTTANLFNGLATDEIYLNKAECLARLNKPHEAMDDLNNLLKKRWTNTVNYPAIVADDSEDALIKVLAERKKELLLRGVRWMDLRRLNADPRFAVTLRRTVNGIIYTLPSKSEKYTFPIPDDIVSFNGIEQNTGWEN